MSRLREERDITTRLPGRNRLILWRSMSQDKPIGSANIPPVGTQSRHGDRVRQRDPNDREVLEKSSGNSDFRSGAPSPRSNNHFTRSLIMAKVRQAREHQCEQAIHHHHHGRPPGSRPEMLAVVTAALACFDNHDVAPAARPVQITGSRRHRGIGGL